MELEFCEELIETIWWKDMKKKVKKLLKKNNFSHVMKEKTMFGHSNIIGYSSSGKCKIVFEPAYVYEYPNDPSMYWICTLYKVDVYMDVVSQIPQKEITKIWSTHNLPIKKINRTQSFSEIQNIPDDELPF